ncbi:N-acyl-L-amino acid amidohydrolase [Salinibacter sp. 10B]|uniref:M20 family metallopeptidase n=1 Tax=Salinibacter sp. 10B TaxID=1923971 RepID=UPI000D2893DF|nr:M20 family metallopeptidase [Salinibacter sp. 10B]PQJ34143.1 N-acyl-L-amino acid amidohydrolase [Salinibacter sp. 10B]
MLSSVSPTHQQELPDAVAESMAGEQSLAQVLVTIRRHLHMYPEVGMNEHETSRFIRQTLEGYGLDVHGPIAGTGLYVDIEGEGTGGCVGYRADIDALPAQDQKRVSYRSQTPNVAHLCGHDAHTAVGMGVALVLHANRDQLPGRARVFFQPNEEGLPSGAPLMIRSGVLEGLDAVYAIHVDPTLDVGRYGLMVGPVTASSDRFDVRVRQEGTGHSARPHEGVDTVWVASQLMNQFYQMADRITDPRMPAIFTVTKMAGGEAHNVIPEEASFGGTLRTVSPEDRKTIRDYMHEAAQRMGTLHDAHIELDFQDGAPPVINDEAAVNNIERTIKDAFGEQAIHQIQQSSMGGEDFAHYLKHVPGAFIRVGTASGPETSFPLHHHRFDIDETPLAPTARLMARVLMNHLEDRLTEDVAPAQSDFSASDNGTAKNARS